MFEVEGDDFFLMPCLTLRFKHQGSWVLSPRIMLKSLSSVRYLYKDA